MNHPEIIFLVLGPLGPRNAAALEATLNKHWRIEGLQELGLEVRAAHTPGVGA